MNELEAFIIQNQIEFEKEFDCSPSLTASAPGRINIIGEHTDYNGGLSLAVGINKWVLVSLRLREDALVVVKSGNYNSKIEFQVGEVIGEEEKWHRIVSGITAILKNNYGLEKGYEAYVWGNIPLGSGVSSSAAIEVALLNGLRSLYSLSFSDTELVLYSQQTEHEYMGVKSGLLDQSTSQFSKQDALLLLDFKTTTHQYIPAAIVGYQWVLVNTMVKRELASSSYSDRVNETQQAFSAIQKEYPAVTHFRALEEKQLDVLHDQLLKNRMAHYIQENGRVLDFIGAIKKGNFKLAGSILNASHISLKELYEVSCDELDYLAEKSLLIDGCVGSRMMGGGFGGCTISLVKENELDKFCQKISVLYQLAFKIKPEINCYTNTNGASVVLHSLDLSKLYDSTI